MRRFFVGAAPFAVLPAIFTFGVWFVFSTVLNHDVGWLLNVARRMGEGAVLYEDVLEVNPPLIVWFSGVAVTIANVLDLPAFQVYRVGVFVVVTVSVSLTGWSARRLFPAHPLLVGVLVSSVAFALIVLPGAEFGQREHLTLALVFPYLCLAGMPRCRTSELSAAPPEPAISDATPAAGVRHSVHLLAAGLAGVGFAMKPHFVLVWLLVEGWLTARRRRSPPRHLAPVLVVGTVLTGYGIVALAIHPEYLSMLALVADDYVRFAREPLRNLLIHGGVGIAGLVTLVFLACRIYDRPRQPLPHVLSDRLPDLVRAECLTEVLLVAGWGFLLVFVLQGKGFVYHLVPALGCVFVAGLLTVERFRHGRKLASRIASSVLLVLAVAFASTVIAVEVGQARTWRGHPGETDTAVGQFIRFLEGLPSGAGFYTVDVHLPPTFPAVNHAGVGWPYPFPALWPFREALLGGPPPPNAPAIVRMVTEELLAREPEFLVVLAPFVEAGGTEATPDRLRFFSEDPLFTRFFRDYVYLEELGAYRVYRRGRGAGRAPRRGSSRRGSGTRSGPRRRPNRLRRLQGAVAGRDGGRRRTSLRLRAGDRRGGRGA